MGLRLFLVLLGIWVIYIAEPDALRFEGRYFCCPEHRDGRNNTAPGKEGV